MVALKQFTQALSSYGLFTIVAVSNLWAGVHAQDDGDYEGDYDEGEEDYTTTTTYDNGQYTPYTTTTENYYTTTTEDYYTTTTTDYLTTPTTTLTTDEIPSYTEEIIPTTTEEVFTPTETEMSFIPTASEIPTTVPAVAAETNQGSSTNVGAIAGGVVGGVAGVAILAALLFFFIRKRKRASSSEQEVFRPQDDDEEFNQPIQQGNTWSSKAPSEYPDMSNVSAPPPPRHSYVGNYQAGSTS